MYFIKKINALQKALNVFEYLLMNITNFGGRFYTIKAKKNSFDPCPILKHKGGIPVFVCLFFFFSKKLEYSS